MMTIPEVALLFGSAILFAFAQELRHSRELKERDVRIFHLSKMCARLMEKADLS